MSKATVKKLHWRSKVTSSLSHDLKMLLKSQDSTQVM